MSNQDLALIPEEKVELSVEDLKVLLQLLSQSRQMTLGEATVLLSIYHKLSHMLDLIV